MNYRYYVKKLTSNELGYRRGRLATGQMFYISKQATPFFPPLSPKINNDSVLLEFNVEYRRDPVFVNLVYHNDKYNRKEGTRDEYRVYLTRDLAPDDFYFRPGDIIVMERTGENKYFLRRYREENSEYEKINSILENNKLRGHHSLTNSIK